GTRARFFRDVANVTIDLNDVERIDFNALGGVDNITVNDLTGTDVTQVNLDLGTGDGAVDTVTVNGTNGADNVQVSADGRGINLFGLSAQIRILGAESGDQLALNAGAGDDVVGVNGTVNLTVDGGDGNDFLIGGPGNETLRGGAGDDIVVVNGGLDTLDGGPGSNFVI